MKITGLEERIFNNSSELSESIFDCWNLVEKHSDEEKLKFHGLSSANLCRWILDYKLGQQLRVGSYGVVYKGTWKGIPVMVKRFVKQLLNERHILDFRAEIAFLSELHHPHIVSVIGMPTYPSIHPLEVVLPTLLQQVLA